MGRKFEKRFTDPGTNEFATMVLGKGTSGFETVLRKHIRAVLRIRWNLNFMHAKVDGVFCIVYGETYLDGGFALDDTSGKAEIELLFSISVEISGAGSTSKFGPAQLFLGSCAKERLRW